ncbi:MAG: MFS transporter [Candidatus Bathyarchaeia archaeon]|jgi:predicted MFS family arabinose efflux permease
MKPEEKVRVLPALLISIASTNPPTAVLSLLLVEISLSLGTPLPLTGQLVTTLNLSALLGSLLVTVLTSRLSYRSLLIAGLAAIAAGSIASAFSTGFTMLLAFTAISGLGIALAIPMTNTLAGEYYPREERGRVISLLGTAAGVPFLVGGVVVSFLAQYGSWRLAFLGFAGALSLLGLISTLVLLPRSDARGSDDGLTYSMRRIAGNRGAVRSLVGGFLASAAEMGLNLYCFSFLKEVYGTGTIETGFIYTGTAAFYIIGGIATSRLIRGLGPRRTTIIGVLGISSMTLAYHYLPGAALSVAAIMAGNLMMGFRLNGNSALSLDQSSDQSGTVMSLNFAALQLGYGVGTGLGGLMLAYAGWGLVGIVLPVIGLCSLLAIRPIKEDRIRLPKSVEGN